MFRLLSRNVNNYTIINGKISVKAVKKNILCQGKRQCVRI